MDNVNVDWNEQAALSAENYLEFTAFSDPGLRDQLAFEGFTPDEVDYAMANIEVDWNEQAALSAGNYLDFSAFSESGLRDQLSFEGFTRSQVDYAIAQMVAQGRL